MANKVLGIEIGQNLTRVVEMDFKTKSPKIYNMFSFATPPDMLNDGGVEVNSLFGAMLHSKLKELRISTNKVVFVLNSTRIANREVELPNVKENKIRDLLVANASDYFPVDLEQYELVHEIIGRTEDGDEKKVRLSVIVVPKDLIRAYELLAKSCGLTVVGLDYTGNAIKQLMQKEIPGDIKVTLKIDESVTILTIMEEEEVKLQRVLYYGIGEALEAIQDSGVFGEYLSFSEAIEVARRKTTINYRFDESGDEDIVADPGHELEAENVRSLKRSVTYSLQTLIGSVSRVLDYYLSRNTDKSIDKIFLIGLGADFSGLSKLMSNELNHKVVSFQYYESIGLHKGINLNNINVSEFFTAIGSLISPLPIITAEKKHRKVKLRDDGTEVPKDESLTGAMVIFAVFAVAAAALAVFSTIGSMRADAENKSLNVKIQQYEYIEDLYNEYNDTVSKKEWIDNLGVTTTTHNNNLVAFISEFEKKMPSKARVLAFVAEEDAVAFTIVVDKKEVVADIIAKLRTFDSIEVGSLSAITEEENESGAHIVQFAIGCKYVNAGPADSETAADTPATETGPVEDSAEPANNTQSSENSQE